MGESNVEGYVGAFDSVEYLEEEFVRVEALRENAQERYLEVEKQIEEAKQEIQVLEAGLNALKESKNHLNELMDVVRGLNELHPMILDDDNTKFLSFLGVGSTLNIKPGTTRLISVAGNIVRYEGKPIMAKTVLFHNCPKCNKEHPVIVRVVRYYTREGGTLSYDTTLLLACWTGGVISIARSLLARSEDFGCPIVAGGTRIEAQPVYPVSRAET